MNDTSWLRVRTVKFASKNRSLSVACLADAPLSCWALGCVFLGVPLARPLGAGVDALDRCVMGLVP
jgi:hypothetical protein